MLVALFLAAFVALGAGDCHYRAYPELDVSPNGALVIDGAYARVTCHF